MKFKGCQYPVMIQPNKVTELNVLKKCVKGLIVGAAVTIDKLENELKKLVDIMPGRFTAISVYYVLRFNFMLLFLICYRL